MIPPSGAEGVIVAEADHLGGFSDQVGLCRPAGSPHGHRGEHERPDHADDQDRGSQHLETLGNVIDQP